MRLVVPALLVLLAARADAGRTVVLDNDATGWKLLGKGALTEAGSHAIVLRNYDGNVDELSVVVEAGAIELGRLDLDLANLADRRFDLDVTLAGETWIHPIDLTDNQDTLEIVTVEVRDAGAPATVWILGRDRRDPDVPPAPLPDLDRGGWTQLGDVQLDGSAPGRVVSAGAPSLTRLVFESTNDIDLLALRFATSAGTWIPYLTMKLRSGARYHVVELPSERAVTAIDFEYTLLNGTDGTVTVWGLTGPAPD